jgi:hypothetical protein
MIAATMAAITLKIIALLETLFACSELAKARRAIESVSSSRASRLVESLRSNSTWCLYRIRCGFPQCLVTSPLGEFISFVNGAGWFEQSI